MYDGKTVAHCINLWMAIAVARTDSRFVKLEMMKEGGNRKGTRIQERKFKVD